MFIWPLILDTCFSRVLGFTAWWHGGGWEGASQCRSQSCLQRRIFLHNHDGQVTRIHRGPTWLSPQNWQGLHIVWFLISPLGLHLDPAHLPPAQEISSLPANLWTGCSDHSPHERTGIQLGDLSKQLHFPSPLHSPASQKGPKVTQRVKHGAEWI